MLLSLWALVILIEKGEDIFNKIKTGADIARYVNTMCSFLPDNSVLIARKHCLQDTFRTKTIAE